MKAYLFYAMKGQAMCFIHVLLNALDLHESGHKVKIVFEGEAVKLPPELEAQQNKLYLEARSLGLIAGVCRACSAQMKVLQSITELGLPLLDDMKGHAGMRPFIDEGFEVIVI